MSNHNYPRRLLDDAIDRAVHEMVQGDPRPGFRRRVLAQLNPQPNRMSWVQKFLVPAGALAAVLLLALWLRPDVGPTETVSTPGPVAQVPPPAPAAPAPADLKIPPTPAPEVARRIDRRREQSIQFTFGDPNDRVIATNLPSARETPPAGADPGLTPAVEAEPPPALPLVHVAPIEALAEIRLKPIEIRPIAVAPSTLR